MKITDEILPLLLKPDCPLSRRKLIEVTYKIALNYITYNHRRIKKVLISGEISQNELALEAISSLFGTDENNRFKEINDSLNNWNPPIENEEEARFFLNKIIQKKVEQHISKLLREADPFFSRILDKVNYQIKKKGYKKIHYLGNVFIVPANINKIVGRLVREDEFSKFPNSLFNYDDDIFQNIFNYLKNECDFTPAIPLNLLIFRLKETESSLFAVGEATSDYLEKSNVDSIVEKALNLTLQKLNESYLQRGKINQSEILLFEKTLRDIASDLKDGGVNPGLHKYLFEHNKTITPELYSDHYRNILEYLFKILKNHIAEELRH